jgi:hypothetical protein
VPHINKRIIKRYLKSKTSDFEKDLKGSSSFIENEESLLRLKKHFSS